MRVPLLDVCAQNLALAEELKAAFERVLLSGHFIMGPDVSALESEVAKFIGAKHALGVSSGTDAILLALMALGIGPGDEVLCPAFTFFATAGCISRVGATPVFVDSDPVTFNMDPVDAGRKITARTRAIIPVHLFGQSAEMQSLMELAQSHNLSVIEDAAQSLGARYKESSVGTLGHFGTFSFFPSKNLGALGDAGLLVTNDSSLWQKAALLRTHGSKPKYFHKAVGGNFRLDTLQAAFLRVKLPHYNEYTRRRQLNAGYYSDHLSKAPGVILAGESEENAKLILPRAASDRLHIWNQYTIRLPGRGRRNKVRDLLTQAGIGTEIYYPQPMHLQECFAMQPSFTREACPAAEKLSQEVLSIPIYPELNESARSAVAQELAKAAASV